MQRTPTQEKLEAQRHQDIRAIIVEALEDHRAQKNLVMLVAFDLGITDATVYLWCHDLGISIDSYRQCKPTTDNATE